jgi:ABC-2 type transport system ATP-binding protein
MSIVVEGVSKLYGQQKALDQVSFSIKPGEIVGFLGPNGAGKSTMMKIITGFVPASSGKVEVVGLNIKNAPLKIKARTGYLAEQNPLYYDMYVKEYLHFIAGVFKLKKPRERIRDIIETVGLEVEQNKKIGALSKGYKQRVGLAQALLHDPEVLILDEPTTGLDPNQLEEIRGLIKKIGAKKTVMLSTHIMQEVEAICDRVIIINKGKIVADKPVHKMTELFTSNTFIEVEFDGEIAKQKLLQIEGVLKVERQSNYLWLIETETHLDVRNQLFQLAVSEELSIASLNKKTAKLEDIFKQLTAKELA